MSYPARVEWLVNIYNVSRKEGGRGHAMIEDCIDISIQGLKEYIKKSKEKQITVSRKALTMLGQKRTTTKTRKQRWKEKQLYGYFKRQTGKISHKMTGTWLWKRNFKRETESLLIATQNNAISK